jgi:hypothetical protein
MTVPLPQPLPTTSGWQLIDWLDESFSSAPAGADGVATITLDPLPTDTRWQLTHMVAFCQSTAAPQMRLYLSNLSPGGLRDGTSAGVFDVADWPMGLMVPPSQSLIAVWTGCNAGDVATLTLQANILRRAS